MTHDKRRLIIYLTTASYRIPSWILSFLKKIHTKHSPCDTFCREILPKMFKLNDQQSSQLKLLKRSKRKKANREVAGSNLGQCPLLTLTALGTLFSYLCLVPYEDITVSVIWFAVWGLVPGVAIFSVGVHRTILSQRRIQDLGRGGSSGFAHGCHKQAGMGKLCLLLCPDSETY